MAGTAQFNEVYPIAGTVALGSTYTPLTATRLTNANGLAGRVDVLLARNSDSAAHVGQVWIFNGSSQLFGLEFSVPAGAGIGGVAPFDVLAAVLPSSQQGIWFQQGWDLYVELATAPAASQYVSFNALGGTL